MITVLPADDQALGEEDLRRDRTGGPTPRAINAMIERAEKISW